MADESLVVANRWGRYWRAREAFISRIASKASISDNRIMATTNNAVNLGSEHHLWRAADALGSNVDATEYKHVVLRTDLPEVHLQCFLVEGANRYG